MNKQTELHKVSINDTSTIIAKFIPSPKDTRHYESEASLEAHLIAQLQNQGYEYASHIKDETALIANLKIQMERLNECEFNQNEWDRFFRQVIAKESDTIADKTALVQENHLHYFEFDNGISKNIKLVYKNDLQRNILQVVNQYGVESTHPLAPSAREGEQKAGSLAREGESLDCHESRCDSRNDNVKTRKNRYDVSILINGLPLVHIELKRRGVELKEAFYQIERYGRESFFAGSGLFNFVQIFIISNGTYAKYYANTTRENYLKEREIKSANGSDSFEFTSFWADFENKQIFDLIDFSATFLAKHALLNVLFKYCVFDSSRNLLVMRPYQIAATEAIMRKIKMALHYKNYGNDKANGYIWHSTGSGKTLTSFKTAQLACEIEGIAKVMFVVDRKDLDSQTVSEYNKFEKNCVEFNKSTKILESRLKDSSQKIIVTTIQKLSVFVKNTKTHNLFDKPCVIIFDECHRSQFGEMNALIKKAFKKYLLFGFTGTPIMDKNKMGDMFVRQNDGRVEKVGQTTDLIFNECLHAYTIANAIKDKNVLPFKVDYNNLVPKFREAECGALFDDRFDSPSLAEGARGWVKSIANSKNPPPLSPSAREGELSRNDDKNILNHPERIKEIVSYVLKNFDKKTFRSGTYKTAQNKRIKGFNSIFASSSIESAKLFYKEFQAQNANLSPKEQLKIATIFSYASNEDLSEFGGFDDENVDSTERLPKSSRDFLDSAISDYNGIFGTNFDTSAENFSRYFVDLSHRVKNKEIDMLIVVDMFLTGFDAKTLNTLWVDKNLRYHGLLQAYSRTNRILDSTKQFGNIICFRDLQKATNESITLFSQKGDDSQVVLMRSFKEYFEGYFTESSNEKGEVTREFHKGYVQIVEDLQQNFATPQNLETIEDKKAFIKAYNALLKIENILSVFDEFDDNKKLIDERTKQNMQSVYLQIKDELTGLKESQSSGDLEDIVFEVELLGQVDINIDFIYALLAKAKSEGDKDKREKILEDIARWVDSSLNLRNKGDLIKEFARIFVESDFSEISEDFIDTEFRAFVRKKKKEELAGIIERENLDKDKTLTFMQKSFKNGEISDLGVDFREILPKASLFAPKNTQNDEKVFFALHRFYEKYRDISGFEI